MNPFFKLWWYIPLITCALTAQQNLIKDSLDISNQINDLDEIVLIDSRFPLKRSESGKTIIKITQATIDNFQGLGLSSLLKQYAGIEILGSQTYAGQNKTISIRGGRNRQVLILIDGIRVSDPSRIDSDFNLNFLDFEKKSYANFLLKILMKIYKLIFYNQLNVKVRLNLKYLEYFLYLISKMQMLHKDLFWD